MRNKNRIFIITVLIILIVLQILSSIYSFYVPFIFYAVVLYYFLLGFINDKYVDKFFIFLISTFCFLGLTSREGISFFSISIFVQYRLSFFLPSFLIGLLVQKMNNSVRESLFFGVAPLLLQSILMSFISVNPLIIIFSLYIIVAFLFFLKVKNLKNNNLFCFLIPLFIYFIVGFFAFKIPGIKEVSIFLSLLIIIFLLYFLIKKFKRNQMI